MQKSEKYKTLEKDETLILYVVYIIWAYFAFVEVCVLAGWLFLFFFEAQIHNQRFIAYAGV